MWTHVFREYLRENEKFRETVFACSYGAHVEFFLSRKMCRKSRFTVPLNGQSRICLYFKESSTVLTVKVKACHLYNFKKCLVIAVCFYACSQCCITITLIKLPRMVGSGLQRNCQQLLDPDYK